MAEPRIHAGYVRVSSARQRDQSDSPASQRQRLKAAGCSRIYEDLAVSGYKLEQRRRAAGFQQLVADITAGRIARLTAVRLDRVARRDQIVIELAELCAEHGVQLDTLQGGVVNVGTASGWLQTKVQTIFGEHYSRALSESIRGGYAGLHAQGIPARPASSLPFHLARDPGTRHGVIPSEHWPAARIAIDRFLHGSWSANQVAGYLRERCDRRWGSGEARRWLRRPALAGHMARRDGSIQIRDCWPAIVTDAEHQQIIERMNATTSRRPVRRGTSGLLSGICCCALCGSRMAYDRVRRPSGTYRYLRCRTPGCNRRSIAAGPVWDVILGRLDERLEELVRRRAVDAGATEEPTEVLGWRRELEAREALPAEMRQPADRERITELQGLIAAAGRMPAPGMDWWPGGLAAGSLQFWSARPEDEINQDLRRIITAIPVDPSTCAVGEPAWRA